MKSVFNHQINQTPTVEICYVSEILFLPATYKIEYQDRAIASLFELLQELQQRANQAMVASSLLKWGPIFH